MMSSPPPSRTKPEKVLDVVAFLLLCVVIFVCIRPIFRDTTTYGGHDWDVMVAYRYLAVKTIKSYHQIPLWDPYSCGGHTWWGGLESGTNLVSPFLFLYLLKPLPIALRIEVASAAVLSAVGCWLFTGRLMRAAGLRLLVASAFAACTRWALGAEMGHMWHLWYALLPWALWFYDRALTAEPGKVKRNLVGLGVVLAAGVYLGAIYPLPHIVAVVGIYAIAAALAHRSWRPITLALAGGVLSFGFAAPRLLPLFEMLRRFPRLTDSPETIDLNGLIGIFTARIGDARPAVGPWGWHEFGIYTGWIPFLAMAAAPLLARTWRERAAMAAGIFCFVLGLGRFSTIAPWAILHDYLPIFQSQHVPSRWLYPAVLVLLASFGASADRLLRRVRGWHFMLEIALLLVGLWVGLDIADQSKQELANTFSRKGPTIAESTGEFHQRKAASAELQYEGADWAPPGLPAIIGNVGLIDCGTFPGLHNYYRDRKGRIPGLGAKGIDEADYRGEAYLASGVGTATTETWTPNAVTIRWEGANAGDFLVMNQNWDAGWVAENGIVNWNDLNAMPVDAPSGTAHFRYRPRSFQLGIAIFVLFVVGLLAERRVRARLSARSLQSRSA